MRRKTIYALTLHRWIGNYCILCCELAQPRILLVDTSLHLIKSTKDTECCSGQKVLGTYVKQKTRYYHFWLYFLFRIVKTFAFQ